MQPPQPTNYSNYSQKYVIIPFPKTLSEYDEYTLSKPDQQSLQFLKDKYLNANPKLKNNASPWQTKSKHDFRRQFVELFKQIAYKNTPPQTHQFTQLTDQTAILTLFSAYFQLLIDHKFLQADNLIKKHNFTAFPRFLKRINAFSLKMIQYQSIVQQNIKNNDFEQQLSFYWKVIQNMHDHKGLRDFMILNQKSPYMNSSLAAKLKKQLFLSQQNYEFLSICKGYERVILQLNNQLSKKPIVSFTQTNAQLSSFYCLDDFKCESTKQSGLKLKNNLRDLICNLTLSREKKVLNEPQKYLHAQQENQTWTYQLLNYFLAILSNDFQQSHFNSLHAYVIKKMHTNKSIRDKLDNLKGVINRSLELVKFEKQIEQLTVNIPSSIENTLSMIKLKGYNTDKMVKLFKRQLIYKLMNQIHRDKTTDTNSTFIESMISKYRKWIDQDNVKSIEKLVLKTGKQRKVLEDLMSSLQEIMNLIGLNPNEVNLNPNTIQFYLQLFRKSQQIYAKLQGKKIPEDQSETTKILAKDHLSQNQIQLSQNNYQKNVLSQDTALKESNLQYQLEKCRKLKNKLLEVFSNFDREIPNLTTSYTVRGGFEITQKSFQIYVNKKREKINKIMAEFDQTYQKGSNLTKIPFKLKSPEQKQAEKFTVKIGLHQLNIFELKDEFLQLDAQLIKVIEQFTKKQKQSQQQIDKLQSQLQLYKKEKSDKQKQGFQTKSRNHNLHDINSINQTKQCQSKSGQFQVFGVPLQVDPFKMPNQKGHIQQNLNKQQYANQYNDQISIENLHQQILQLQSGKNNLNSIIQDKNEEILQLSTKNQKLLSQIQQLKGQLEKKKNETIKRQRSLNVATQCNEKVVQSKNHKIEELQTKIIELNNKVSQLSQTKRLYEDLKAKMTQMRMDSRKQKQANTKQLELISQFQKQIQRQKQQIFQLQLSKQSINQELTESKKKVSSQTYQIANLKIEIEKYEYRIKQLQEKTGLQQQQQQEIKTLNQQLQSKSNNVFKREEENDKKVPSRFRSLKEPDQSVRSNSRSISRRKQQLLNAINSKNSVDSGKIQQQLITRKDHELKIKQNTQNLKQQFEKELATKLQNIKLQFAKQKQSLQEKSVKLEKDLNVLTSRYQESSIAQQKHILRVDELQQQKLKLEEQTIQLKQQKQNVEKQLSDLKQLVAKQQEKSAIKIQNKLIQSQLHHTESVQTLQTLSAQFQEFMAQSIEKEALFKQQIEGHQSTILRMNMQQRTQKVKIQKLNHQIATKQKQIQSSQDKISQLKIKNQQLSLKNQQLQTQNQQLFTQKQQLFKHNQQLSTQIQQLFSKNQQAENDLNLFKQEFVNKQLLFKKAQDKIALLQKQIQNYGPDMQNLRLQVKDYQYNIRQLRQRINNQLHPEIKQLKVKLKTLNEESRQLKKQSAEQIKRVKLQSSRQLNQLERQKSSLQFQIQNLKKKSEQQIQPFKLEISKLSQSLQQKTQSTANLQIQLQKTKLNLAEESDNVNELSQKITCLQQQLRIANEYNKKRKNKGLNYRDSPENQLSLSLIETSPQKQTKQATTIIIDERLVKLTQENTQKQKLIQSLQQANNKIKAQLDSAIKGNQSLQHDNKTLLKRIQVITIQNRKLSQTRKEPQSKLKLQQPHLNSEKIAISDELRGKNQHLQQKMISLEKGIALKQLQISKLEKSNKELISDHLRETSKYEKQITSLKEQLLESKTKFALSQRQVKQLKSKNQQLERIVQQNQQIRSEIKQQTRNTETPVVIVAARRDANFCTFGLDDSDSEEERFEDAEQFRQEAPVNQE